MVSTQATTMLPATPHRTADSRFVAPTPRIDDVIVCVVEIGLISPPVGMNMFVLKSLLPEISTGTIFRGVMPFVAVDCLRLAILVAFPVISTFLPSFMK